MSDETTFVVALTGLVAALVGGYVTWRKLKPETADIVVTTAERASEMTLKWTTRVELANAIFDYLEIWHNRNRRHSQLGWLSPIEYERNRVITVA